MAFPDRKSEKHKPKIRIYKLKNIENSKIPDLKNQNSEFAVRQKHGHFWYLNHERSPKIAFLREVVGANFASLLFFSKLVMGKWFLSAIGFRKQSSIMVDK